MFNFTVKAVDGVAVLDSAYIFYSVWFKQDGSVECYAAAVDE